MAGEQGINVGSIIADLQVDSTHLERGLANARKAINAVEIEIKQLDYELEHFQISVGDHDNRMRKLMDTYFKLTDAQRQAYSATTNIHTGLELFNQGMGKVSGSTNMAGMGIMQLGYIVDDLQYGFRSVVNNIGPFTYAVTAAMGLSTKAAMAWSGGIQMVGVAAYQLYNNWDSLMDAMGTGRVLSEAEEMEELGKKTAKTADETERLNKYKKEQLEIKRLLEDRSPEQERQEKATREAVAALGDEKATGGQKLVKAIADSIRADGLGAKMSPEEKAELDKIRDRVNGKAPVPAEEGGVFVGLGNLMAGGANAQGAATMPTPAQVQAMREKAQKEFDQKQNEINERINKEDADRAKQMGNDAMKSVDDKRALIRRLEPNPANRETVEALKATLPENVMAKNIGDMWEKVKEKGQDALDHFFEEFKKKATKAANEEQDFHENARNVFGRAVKDAKGMIPGVDKIAQFHVARAMLGGNPEDIQRVREQIIAELGRQGINKGVAGGAADDILKDADKKIKEDVIDEMLNGRQEKATRSQQFDAAELAARVQAGVGGDESRKHTTLMQKMVVSLANIEKQKGNVPFGVEE